jgi:simple sugar transport system ATP-binding protein
MNVLSGLYRPDAGHIRIDGASVEIASPLDAIRHRIGMVHQHFELVPPFTGFENVVVGREGSRWRLHLDRHAVAVEALARRFGLAVDLGVPVRRLAIGDQQKVEILKALFRGVDVLILDEPTTVLTPQESDRLLRTIRAMAADGLTVVFISHKIRELLEHCDRLTVMRGGRTVGTVEAASASADQLVELMIGERLSRTERPERQRRSGDALRLHDVTVAGAGAAPRLARACLAVGRGEIVGVAGVAGNGQRELAEAIVGVQPIVAGRVEINGADLTAAPVRARIARGLFYVPEDRLGDGILPSLSVAENLFVGVHRFAGGESVNYRPQTLARMARRPMAEYKIVATDPGVRAATLSGGNIQKILIARALMLASQREGGILVAHNPTRGLDVRTSEFVRGCLLAFTRAGGGVLLISSDLDELMDVCHRIVVLFRGTIVADLASDVFDPYRVGRLMTGGAAAVAVEAGRG